MLGDMIMSVKDMIMSVGENIVYGGEKISCLLGRRSCV